MGLRAFIEEVIYPAVLGFHNYTINESITCKMGYYIGDNLYFASPVIVVSTAIWATQAALQRECESQQLPTQRVVTYQTLRELAETLPQPPFLRVQKSFIVSLDKIRMVDGNTIYIQDREIPVGETYREQLYRLIREA